jgi:hypothetical protein
MERECEDYGLGFSAFSLQEASEMVCYAMHQARFDIENVAQK